METPSSTLGLKIFAVLGALVLLGLVSLPVFIGYLALSGKIPSMVQTENETPFTSTTTQLGELGSQCGGPARLPCKPGLTCSADPKVDNSTGVCEEAKPESPGQPQAGMSCAEMPCANGLYCRKTTQTCATIDETAPHVVSVTVASSQLVEGVYEVPVDTATKITVQTVNAEKVTMMLNPDEGFGTAGISQWLTSPKREKGGAYTAALTFRHEFKGSIEIVVTSKTGDSSTLLVPIASIK
jgi:hypothetical protein